MFRKSKRMHFIGIGGIGMSGIAEILINLGYEVSGSDLRKSEQTERLGKLGAKVFIGHAASNIGDYHVVVTSSAINPANPELLEARARKIPVIHRSEMLAELVRLKHGIGVRGPTSTTTSSPPRTCWTSADEPRRSCARSELSLHRAHRPKTVPWSRGRRIGRLVPETLLSIAIVTNIDVTTRPLSNTSRAEGRVLRISTPVLRLLLCRRRHRARALPGGRARDLRLSERDFRA